MKNEKGKKKRDILSMHNAVSCPWQEVTYCGIMGTDLVGLPSVDAISCKYRSK
jgi:hypothetical protein